MLIIMMMIIIMITMLITIKYILIDTYSIHNYSEKDFPITANRHEGK